MKTNILYHPTSPCVLVQHAQPMAQDCPGCAGPCGVCDEGEGMVPANRMADIVHYVTTTSKLPFATYDVPIGTLCAPAGFSPERAEDIANAIERFHKSEDASKLKADKALLASFLSWYSSSVFDGQVAISWSLSVVEDFMKTSYYQNPQP